MKSRNLVTPMHDFDTCDAHLASAAEFLVANQKYATIEQATQAIVQYTKFGDATSIDTSYSRISWDEYFISLAFLVSKRSPDCQTQHGAVIVDHNNKIVSTGYNGFLPGVEDKCMPNTRPAKYQHIIHAEVNAILSAAQDLVNCKIYITGLPCNECLKVIAKTGIKHVIVGDRAHVVAPGYYEMQALICAMHHIQLEKFVGNLVNIEGRHIDAASHTI